METNWNSQENSEKHLRRLVELGGAVTRLPSGAPVGRMVAKEDGPPIKSKGPTMPREHNVVRRNNGRSMAECVSDYTLYFMKEDEGWLRVGNTMTLSFNKDNSTGCWNWRRHISNNGYGVASVGRGCMGAHRLMWNLLVGPSTEGMVMDHLCRNRSCVNPGHIREVTTRENLLCGTGASARNAKKTKCKMGHPFSGRNLRIDPHGKRRICRACFLSRQKDRYWRKKKDALSAYPPPPTERGEATQKIKQSTPRPLGL